MTYQKTRKRRAPHPGKIADPELRQAVVEAITTEGAKLEPIARRLGLTERRVQALRDLIVRIKPDLAFIRDQEPVILDALRVDALHQFQADQDRKWSVLEYAILVDKARLMRGESSLNISGLMGLVSKAETREAERFKAIAAQRRATDPAQASPPPPAPAHGGDPAPHPPADGSD